MASRNVPSITPSRRPKPPPPPSYSDIDRGVNLRAAAAQRAATAARTPQLTPAQSAYGPSGTPSVADVQALQRRQAPQQQAALWTPAPSGDRNDGPADGPPPPSPPPTRTPQYDDFAVSDFRDAEYNAQIAALDRALRDFETGAQQRGERYGIDYLQGVRNIGYRPDPGFVAMPNLLEAGQEQATPMARSARSVMGAEEVDPTKGMRGIWDIEGQFDPYSAAARGTRGLRDEFAARGTLRGTDFERTRGEFQNRLDQQFEAMETGRARFSEDLAQEIAGQRSGTEERRQAAERAASQRAATTQMNAFMRALAGG